MKVSYLIIVLVFRLCTCEENCTENFSNLYEELQAIHPYKLNKLYLLSSNSTLNHIFSKIAHHLGFSIVNIPEFCSDGLQTTEIVMKSFKNAINLKVKVTDKVYNLASKNLTAVGSPFSEKCHRTDAGCERVCKSGNSIKKIDGTDYETCNVTISSVNTFTKVISQHITRYKVLHEVLKKIYDHYKEESYPNWRKIIAMSKKGRIPFEKGNILVCTDANGSLYVYYIEGVRYVYDCERIDDYTDMGIVAALAPKPLKEEAVTHLPVIFYNTPYLLPEDKDKYPNAILFDNYNSLLINSLVEFIQKQQWNRIAIVSDDSPYSDAFESELITQFQKKRVVYSLKQCLGRTCNFNKALNELIEDQARIIIANVDEEYAKQLVETAATHGMTSWSGVMWIWRGWPFERLQEIKDLGEVFSLNLVPFDNYKDLLENIKKTVRQSPSIHPEGNVERKHYRKLTAHIRKNLRNLQAPVKLIKMTQNTKTDIFSSYGDGIKIHHRLNYTDLAEPCNTRSNSFNSPCEDSYPLILLLVIGVFLLASLVIFLMFQRYARRPREYHTLS